MIRINLLPYRPQRRRLQVLRHLGAALGVILTAAAIALAADWVASSELASLQEEYSSLKAQNDALQKKIGELKNLDALRADVTRKLETVDELQQGRFRSFEMLAEISKVIPENVWLTSIADNGPTLALSGLAESNKAVANFMRALDRSPLFENVRVSVITRKDVRGVPVRSFGITVARTAPEKAGKGGAKQGGKRKAGGRR
ncbi:MAG: PilN domain-containing protein [Mariprofundaceae bacterium]